MFETLEEALSAAHALDLGHAESNVTSETTLDNRPEIDESMTEAVTEDAEKKRVLMALSVVLLGLIAFVVIAPLAYYGSKGTEGQNTSGLAGGNPATLEQSLGFRPPDDWQFLEEKDIQADDDRAALCYGSAGRLYRFETTDRQPSSAVEVLDKAIGSGRNLLAGLGFNVSANRAYNITGGRTLYLTTLEGGSLFLCVTPSS
jgi:hypothetical protein